MGKAWLGACSVVAWTVGAGCSVRGGDPGSDGLAGVSVAMHSVAPGDSNCPAGGVELDVGEGPAFVCNGTPAPVVVPATRYLSIAANTCTPQEPHTVGVFVPGWPCTSTETHRTNGDQVIPCQVSSHPEVTVATYLCPVALPSGSVIEEVVAFGMDLSPTGYFEAAIWRGSNADFAIEYISGFGGTWQTSGVAFRGGNTQFELFSLGHPPHVISPDHRYVIGFALSDSGAVAGASAFGFRVRYREP